MIVMKISLKKLILTNYIIIWLSLKDKNNYYLLVIKWT